MGFENFKSYVDKLRENNHKDALEMLEKGLEKNVRIYPEKKHIKERLDYVKGSGKKK